MLKALTSYEKIKNFANHHTLVTLIGSNAFWLLVWVDCSLNEKTQDIDIAYHQSKAESYFEFIKRVSVGSKQTEIEQLLQTHYTKEYWSSDNVLSTKDIKFIFNNGKLVQVEKQTELAPHDKG